MTEADMMELRAALMQIEKVMETERACIIRVRKVIERAMQLPQEAQTVTISSRDSVAGYAIKSDL